MVDKDLINGLYGEYINDVTEKLEGYDEICKELWMMPEVLKSAGMV